MSVLQDVLLEEYERQLRIREAIQNELKQLPKGSVQRKIIHGCECFYLVYRNGNRVVSDYIRRENLSSIRQAVERRKENTAALHEVNMTLKQIEKALGKDYVNEHTE